MRSLLFLRILPVALILFAPIAVAETDEKEPDWSRWTPELSLRYRSIGGTAVSADGSLVAYVVRDPRTEGEKSEFINQIYVAASDGSSDIRYTRPDLSASSPRFSPDGQYLAFLAKAGEKPSQSKPQIWLMRVRGGEAEPITKAKSAISNFRWSPDSSRIAYQMADPPTEEEETDKKEKRDVILVHQQFKYAHLYVVPVEPDASGKREPLRLTEGDFHITGFDWAPDGATLAFAYQDNPLVNSGQTSGDISLVSAEGGEPQPLVTQAGVDRNPIYAPDGRHIAFLSTGDQIEPVGMSDVYVVEPRPGAMPRRLDETFDRSPSLVGWTANSASILVSESVRTLSRVQALAADGGEASDVIAPDGSVGSVALSGDSQTLAFTYTSLTEPVEVYAWNFQDKKRIQLSSVNGDLPEPAMGDTQLLRWEAPDGMGIEGLLTTPIGHEHGQKVPLILLIHGGPGGKFGQSYTGAISIYPLQVFAQQGYAVLRPNPRGSLGYGKEFRYANVADWGQGDYDDVMAGVDLLVEQGLADPERLYVMGWSYGGYLTSYVVTRTDRFQAASVGAGLPDLVSMVYSNDISAYLIAHMGGKELWEDYEIYQKHSAMYRLNEISTPTQVIHGREDRRVPFDQGRAFFIALERKGVPTEMVVYPRTPHGPREPKFLMDVSGRILDWFAQFGGPERVEPQAAE